MSTLSDRDQQIVEHVVRFRLTTDDVLLRRFLPGVAGVNAVQKVTGRLAAGAWLRRQPLGNQKYYYVVGRTAAEAFRSPRRRADRFSEQTLPVAMAVLYHCAERNVWPYTEREFSLKYPDLYYAGHHRTTYFYDSSTDRPRIGCFLVDRGNTPLRLRTKLTRLIEQRYPIPKFRDLILNRRFAVRILTAFPAAREALAADLQAHHRGPVAVSVEIRSGTRRLPDP
ncbi:MAG: hypothetical protein H0T47_06530 [Planctomycetaceae bacterium]|nr:hypothetical protein [Planctomycetaceae bacterium]